MGLYRIMLVDDEEEVRKAMIRKMDWEKLGFTVVGDAENGEDALEKLEHLEPDVVMTDIRMPYMDGLTLTAKIREKYPSIKILIFSGPLKVVKVKLYKLPTMRARYEVMLFCVGSFLGFPDVVRPYGRGAGHIDLAVSESLCTLFRQADRVGLLLAGSWVLVHLVKKKVFHGEGSKPGRAVTPNKFYKHIIKI